MILGRLFSSLVAVILMLAGALGQGGLLTRAAPVLQPLMFALASLMLVTLGLIKSMQPAMFGSDGLLCFIMPGLGGLMR